MPTVTFTMKYMNDFSPMKEGEFVYIKQAKQFGMVTGTFFNDGLFSAHIISPKRKVQQGGYLIDRMKRKYAHGKRQFRRKQRKMYFV